MSKSLYNVLDEVEAYVPCNEQEERDRKIIIEHLLTDTDCFDRTNQTAHMTASAWVVNRDLTSALMIYHNIYKSWSWMGGHADGEMDLAKVAEREIREESGIEHLSLVTEDIFSLETLCVNGHIKREKYVPCHLHLNLTYLFVADDKDTLFVKPDENSGVRWIGMQDVLTSVTEPWMNEWIYAKLLEKQKNFLSKIENALPSDEASTESSAESSVESSVESSDESSTESSDE